MAIEMRINGRKVSRETHFAEYEKGALLWRNSSFMWINGFSLFAKEFPLSSSSSFRVVNDDDDDQIRII